MEMNVQKELERLNFSGVLNYKRPIVLRPRDGSPLNTCVGFCHDCENHGFAPKGGSDDILMSHGCTSEDFSEILGQPLPGMKCSEPIMFLLENPGGDYDLGDVCVCENIRKKPPNKHFYFSSDLKRWPTSIADIQNRYGDYFAYLMAKFGLSNVYITNCIKCKYGAKWYAETADNCIARFLEREILLFRPRFIFCFGKRASDELLWKRIQRPKKLPDVKFRKVTLLHPATRRKWRKVVQENDRRINKTLKTIIYESMTLVNLT